MKSLVANNKPAPLRQRPKCRDESMSIAGRLDVLTVSQTASFVGSESIKHAIMLVRKLHIVPRPTLVSTDDIDVSSVNADGLSLVCDARCWAHTFDRTLVLRVAVSEQLSTKPSERLTAVELVSMPGQARREYR
jgi:hypothetical protein